MSLQEAPKRRLEVGIRRAYLVSAGSDPLAKVALALTERTPPHPKVGQ